jgi:ELWxxDGT repeat protein
MRTDGTEAGTQPIMRDVELCDSLDFALAPDAVYFKGGQPATGCELWRTDGTADGTRMVKEVQPGPGTTPFWLAGLVYAGGLVYFQGCDPVSCTLWRSDGTEEGTFDLGVTASSVPGTSCAPFRDMLLFVRNTPEYGPELWRTDGSVAGTRLVKDIHPGPNGSILSMNGVSQGDAYVFFAIDAQHGREPWRTDGTAAGTYLLRDIQPGPSAFPWNALLGVPGRGTFFMGNDGVHGNELWLTDGHTAAGTRPLTNLPANTGGVWPQIVTDRYLLFFVSSPVYGGEPWAYELAAIPQ